jgi:FOG: FHA domain
MSMTTFGPDVPRTALGTRTELNHLANPPTLVPLDDEGEPIVLDRKVITVGRTRDNDVCVPSVLVSRAHARMVIGDDGVVLFDIGSINGSFVNDRPVKKHTLQDGDIVRFADRRYRFCQSALR